MSSKKRLIGMVVSVALAAIGTFGLLSYVKGADERALAGEATVEVLVVETPIERGTPVAEVARAVTTERVPVKVRADGSVTSLSALQGTVTAVDLVPGEQVVAARFVDPVELATERVVEVPDGMLEVTISLSPERAVGGQPLPGDTVAVVASFADAATGESSDDGPPGTESSEDEVTTAAATHIILHKALVVHVQATDPTPAAQPADVATVQHLAAPSGTLLLTLALSAPDVEKVVFAAEHGTIWLAREPGNAPEDGTQIVTSLVIYR